MDKNKCRQNILIWINEDGMNRNTEMDRNRDWNRIGLGQVVHDTQPVFNQFG